MGRSASGAQFSMTVQSARSMPQAADGGEVLGDGDDPVGLAQQAPLERLEAGADAPAHPAHALLHLGRHGHAVQVLQPEDPGTPSRRYHAAVTDLATRGTLR